jgi:hypothetical protein
MDRVGSGIFTKSEEFDAVKQSCSRSWTRTGCPRIRASMRLPWRRGGRTTSIPGRRSSPAASRKPARGFRSVRFLREFSFTRCSVKRRSRHRWPSCRAGGCGRLKASPHRFKVAGMPASQGSKQTGWSWGLADLLRSPHQSGSGGTGSAILPTATLLPFSSQAEAFR